METVKVFNATELWQKETSLPCVPTFSQSFDKILGNGGVQLGRITELLGLPGSGKTQLCLQLCASVQIPKQLGGLDAEALFIDTNTNFTLARFREILSASLTRCQKVLDVPLQSTEDEALKRLHYVNAFGLESYCSLMYRLPKFIADHPKIKLIAIDSITYPFKDGISPKQRTGLLFRQMAELQRIAVTNQIAVVLTNEMSTRVGLSGGSVVGALGDAWAHRCTSRVLLAGNSDGSRHALLLKSNITGTAVASFQVILTNEMSTRVGLSGGSVVGALGDAWAHRCTARVLLAGNSDGTRHALLLKSNITGTAVAPFQVVLTNEMSTRVGLSGGSVVGALGDAWAHRCTTRVLLAGNTDGSRHALLLKSNITGTAVAPFQVVLTNEMSTRVGLSGGSVVGALGDAWAHRCTTRVLLAGNTDGSRHALLLKSNITGTAVAPFQVVLTNEMSTRVGLSGGSVVGALGDAWAHRCTTRVLLAGNTDGSRHALLLKSNITGTAVAPFQVVLTNEMSTRVGLSGGSVVGALGDAWAHRCTARVLLAGNSDDTRHALLLKSNITGTAVAPFQITSEGIRDVE